MAALPPAFFDRPAELVARELLGAVLCSTVDGVRTAGRIVETEAYIGPEDAASHAAEHVGRTGRNRSMFGPPGIAYVYRSYGIHWCVNAVTGRPDRPAAALIRALEPLSGIPEMRRRRRPGGGAIPDRELARGPGRLCQALGITGALDGHPLQDPPLELLEGDPPAGADILASPRIGIRRAADWPLRFRLRASPWVSR